MDLAELYRYNHKKSQEKIYRQYVYGKCFLNKKEIDMGKNDNFNYAKKIKSR